MSSTSASTEKRAPGKTGQGRRAQRPRSAGLSGFVDTRVIDGLTVRLAVKGGTGQESRRRRALFDGDRSGTLLGYENRVTRRGEFISLTVSGRF